MSKPILIGNKIKPTRKPTRTEHIYGVPYVFADKNGDGHFITEVTDPKTAELMLSKPDHFYPYPPDQPRLSRGAPPAGDDHAAALAAAEEKARKEAEQAAADEAAKKAAAEAAEAEAKRLAAAGNTDPKLVAEANELLKLSAKDMATAMQKVSSPEVIPVALALEEADEKRRANVVKLLTDAIELAKG